MYGWRRDEAGRVSKTHGTDPTRYENLVSRTSLIPTLLFVKGNGGFEEKIMCDATRTYLYRKRRITTCVSFLFTSSTRCINSSKNKKKNTDNGKTYFYLWSKHVVLTLTLEHACVSLFLFIKKNLYISMSC
jgi:hypothetical protein